MSSNKSDIPVSLAAILKLNWIIKYKISSYSHHPVIRQSCNLKSTASMTHFLWKVPVVMHDWFSVFLRMSCNGKCCEIIWLVCYSITKTARISTHFAVIPPSKKKPFDFVRSQTSIKLNLEWALLCSIELDQQQDIANKYLKCMAVSLMKSDTLTYPCLRKSWFN